MSRSSDRWIRCWWDEEIIRPDSKFSTGLRITASSRTGMLADIAMLLAQAHVNVRDITARELDDNFSVMTAVIEVNGVAQLENLMGRIKKTKGILDVTRTKDGN